MCGAGMGELGEAAVKTDLIPPEKAPCQATKLSSGSSTATRDMSGPAVGSGSSPAVVVVVAAVPVVVEGVVVVGRVEEPKRRAAKFRTVG